MFRQQASLDALFNRVRPSFWSLFRKAPLVTLAQALYNTRQTDLVNCTRTRSDTNESPITVTCISDTHNSQPTIPRSDLFIHAGDLSQGGTRDEIQEALNWINALPHQFKVVIAGNHDMYLDPNTNSHDRGLPLEWGSIIYLEDESAVLRFQDGRCLAVYGTPHTRKHGSWGFQFRSGLDQFSNTIPEDTDILISHSPPRFHRDVAGWGDDNLLNELWRVKPRLHVFGHVHEGYGKDILVYDEFQYLYEKICRQSAFINAWYLTRMAVHLLSRKLFNTVRAPWSTVAINAAAVGGLRDSQRRESITVTI